MRAASSPGCATVNASPALIFSGSSGSSPPSSAGAGIDPVNGPSGPRFTRRQDGCQQPARLRISLAADPPGRTGARSPVGERDTLARFLRDYRLTLELKCEGLDAAAMAAQSVPPSDLSLLGLVRVGGLVNLVLVGGRLLQSGPGTLQHAVHRGRCRAQAGTGR
jgi:hypothetical protein